MTLFRCARVALYAILVTSPPLVAQPNVTDSLDVTIVANEGVLLHGVGGDLLIDGAFGPGLPEYTALAPAQRADLENARAPFDRIRLILVTHPHRDHFNARSVASLMRASGARMIAPPEVLDSMQRVAPDLATQIQAVLPPDGTVQTIDVPGVARVHVHGALFSIMPTAWKSTACACCTSATPETHPSRYGPFTIPPTSPWSGTGVFEANTPSGPSPPSPLLASSPFIPAWLPSFQPPQPPSRCASPTHVRASRRSSGFTSDSRADASAFQDDGDPAPRALSQP
jgi:hypothetical protein